MKITSQYTLEPKDFIPSLDDAFNYWAEKQGRELKNFQILFQPNIYSVENGKFAESVVYSYESDE